MEGRIARDSRIVDENVDRADLLSDFLQTLGAILVVRNVPFIDRNAGVGLELLGRQIIPMIGRGNLLPRLLQGIADSRANPARPPAHNRHSRHVGLPKFSP